MEPALELQEEGRAQVPGRSSGLSNRCWEGVAPPPFCPKETLRWWLSHCVSGWFVSLLVTTLSIFFVVAEKLFYYFESTPCLLALSLIGLDLGGIKSGYTRLMKQLLWAPVPWLLIL